MYCSKCGAQIGPGTSYCQKCGAAINQPVIAQPPATATPPMPDQTIAAVKTSGMATASLVLGIFSIFFNVSTNLT